MTTNRSRRWWYPAALATIYTVWLTFMMLADRWALFRDFWPMSVTMAFGSFVAGSTAAGGGAVAYPVFTKLLSIPSADARTFSLMIQSFGMSMASLVIFALRAPVLKHVIGWSTLGGVAGMLLGTFTLSIPSPYPKIIFTTLVMLFGVTLAISRWGFAHHRPRPDFSSWGWRERGLFVLVGALGGAVSSVVGSGIDMIVFMVLTLAFGIDEKVGTLTSVPIMAANSLVGFFTHGVLVQDIGIVWNYWLVCVPIVILGAPLGSFVASKLGRDPIIIFLLLLISTEVTTTLLVTPITPQLLPTILAVVVVSGAIFGAMLRYRAQARAAEAARPPSA